MSLSKDQFSPSKMLPRILNCACYAGVFATYVITGFLGVDMSRMFTYMLKDDLPGKPYPDMTACILSLATSYAYFFANLLLGAVFAALLFYLEFSDSKRRGYLTFCLASALILNFVQLAILFWGLCLPYQYVTYGMSDLPK
jgi:hypothetical protein